MSIRYILFFLPLFFITCAKTTTPDEEVVVSKISITNSQSFEGTSNPNFTFEITIAESIGKSLEIPYTLEGITAEPNVDFTGELSGTITINAGELKSVLNVSIVNDDENEVDEKMRVGGIGTIKDDDEVVFADDDGYSTSREHFGYDLVMEDEFDGTQLDESIYNYEYGASGWGNNELQDYGDLPENIFLDNSKMTIRATKGGDGKFRSARITTQNKKEFKFGRIDVRAKLPKGQGIWPAIWMLGKNIDEVSWPACGEIDIMELVGHEPKVSHGTAHWGLKGEPSTFVGSSYAIEEDFQERFHVFSIVWEFNEIIWYVDETQFHKIDISQMRGKPYPFNNEFFFIFNVAVGGNWPGNPDETTVFPQEMVVDYVRVFQ